ncbi:MAG: lipocalin-like domain-containing protein [bacterium]|jgi:hypothetical protein
MTKKEQNPLVGSWDLVSFEIHRKNGKTHLPFGKNARGLLIFTASGRVTANLSQNGRMEIKSGDMMDATHEEMATSFRGYISYFGTYEYFANSQTVMHHVTGSLFPNWIGDTLKRNVKLDGNRLELITEPTLYGSEEITAVVVWEKIS